MVDPLINLVHLCQRLPDDPSLPCIMEVMTASRVACRGLDAARRAEVRADACVGSLLLALHLSGLRAVSRHR